MTGEIDLNGSVHETGGLESKIEGGKLRGLLRFISGSNQKDVDMIKKKEI